MFVRKMVVGKMSVRKMSVGKMVVRKMFVRKLLVGMELHCRTALFCKIVQKYRTEQKKIQGGAEL